MEGEQKQKKRKRILPGLLFSLVPIAILAYFAISLISGHGLGISRIVGLFSSQVSDLTAEYLRFDIGRDTVFANSGDSTVAAGTLGIQILGPDGEEIYRDPIRMSYPAIGSSGDNTIVFDIGGTSVRVFSKTEPISSYDSDNPVISASINENGWYCICKQSGGGYNGSVSVYNAIGKEIYKVSLASGYILTAVISPDNKTLAILEMMEGCSRLAFYSLDSEDIGGIFDLPNSLILDVLFLPNGKVLAFSENSLLIVNTDGNGEEVYSFNGKRLGGYTYESEFIALYLLDYGIGYSGRIVTISEDGKILGEIMTDREILSISSRDGYLSVLRSDGVFIYSGILKEFKAIGEPVSTSETHRIVALGGGAALVVNDYSAVVYKADIERGDDR